MVTPMTRNGFSDLLYPGLNKTYTLWTKSYPEEYTKFLNIDSSTKSQEEDIAMAGFGAVPMKTEGDTPVLDALKLSDKVQYVHDTYALGFEITEEAYEDELYGLFQKAPKALAIAVKQTCDVLGAMVLNNAFTAAYAGIDGHQLCYHLHPQLKAGGTVSNMPSGGVSVDLSASTLYDALETWETWTDDNNFPMLMKPKYLVSGPAQRKMMNWILQSTGQPFTSDNEVNAVREWELEKMILHYLTDTDAWFLLSPKDMHYMKWFWRIKPKFRNYDEPNTGNARYLVRFRASCGFTHWHGVYGSAGV
jgi:extradiol dioxygenase family protein